MLGLIVILVLLLFLLGFFPSISLIGLLEFLIVVAIFVEIVRIIERRDIF